MSLPIDDHTRAEIARAAREANRAALDHPAKMAAYLDHTWEPRAHSDLISRHLADLANGNCKRLLITTPPQVGKPVHVGALVMMSDGTRKRLADVHVGDQVITHHLRARLVTEVHRQGPQRCVRITTTSGRVTIAALDHPFMTAHGWVEAGQLTNHHTLAAAPEPHAPGLLPDPVARVENVGYQECRCLTVDEDHTFTADDLVVHNSTLAAEWFPYWWLARNPRHRIVIGSYGTSLANRRGRVVRRMVREHGWRWDMQLEYGAASVAEWALETGGGLKSVGVGSAVTGSPADCVAAGTLIHTEAGLIPAARLARMRTPPRVASYNHPEARFEYNQLVAVRAIRVHQLREIKTETGRSLWCTHDHPIYVIGRGYVPAVSVRPGEEVIAASEQPPPNQPRSFKLPGDPEATRPAMRPPHAHTSSATPLPARRRDWVTTNKIVRTGRTHTVYDFQVDKSPNFVADGILAHNCAIIDDPHKNRAEAESLVMRDRVWDWWSADITSRLAPGAPIALILTRWSIDDVAARVLEQDGTEDEGGLWRILRMPAFADETNDPLGRNWGEPLPHPKVTEGDQETAREHWEMKRNTSLVRDWHALYQADPKPNEGALVTPEVMRARRYHPPQVEQQRFGVAIDPAGEGRDIAGVIGGFLGTDGNLYVTHDASRNGHSRIWAMQAALMCAEQEADFIIFEKSAMTGENDLRDAFDSAWDRVARWHNGQEPDEFDDPDDVRRARELRYMPAHPQIKVVVAKKGKLLRAEPVAQQWWYGRMRTGSYLSSLEAEWTSWQVTDPMSPGRIDASVYLAYELLPIPGSEAMVSVVNQLSREQVMWESQRRQAEQRVAQPQMGARIQRNPIRPGQ